jgi:hypothetical protein
MQTSNNAPQDKAQPLVEEFQWTYVPEGSNVPAAMAAQFAGEVQDIAHGLGVVMGMLEQDDLADVGLDADGRPLPKLMGSVEAGRLQRLSITALKMLGDRAEAHAKIVREMAERSATKH